MNEFCQNPHCENRAVKEVPVSVGQPANEARSLCATCEEAYTWGVQHGTMAAALDRIDAFLLKGGFVVVALNRQDPSEGGAFEAWAYGGPLDFGVAAAFTFGVGRSIHDALGALDQQLLKSPRGRHGSTDKGDRLHVNERELATILAALRFHQDENLQGGDGIPDEAIRRIATNAGVLEALNFDEVGELCERINLGESPVDWEACEHDWREIRGPKTGCDVEYWFRCLRCGATRYRCVDQDGGSSEEIHPPEGGDEEEVLRRPDAPGLAAVHPGIRRIHDLLYLDIEDGREFYNPDKQWDADTMTMIAEAVAEYIPRPEKGSHHG